MRPGSDDPLQTRIDALRRSEERYRLLFGSISDAILVHPFHEDLSPEIFVEVNDVACERLGWTREELLQKSTYDIDAEEGLGQIPEAMRRLKADGHAEWEGMHRTRDGRKIPVEISNRLFEMDGVPMILATVRDISERKNAEETLNALLNATTDMALLVASDGVLLACNDAFARAAGRRRAGELTGHRIWDMADLPLDGAVREHVQKAIQTASPVRIETRNGESIHDMGIFPILDATGVVRRLAFFVRDITASRQTEEQLRQAQKMEAVGRLAGGIAHDFNNLITVIKGFSDLVLNAVPKGSRAADDIAQVKDAADRATELTSRLLTFSRKQVLNPRVMDPVALIRGIEKMLKRVIGEDIEVRAELPADTGRIMADHGQVEQVLLNLAVNARDAMPHGGKLSAFHVKRGDLWSVRDGVPGPARRRVRQAPRQRHGDGHGRGNPGAHLRAVLHDQGAGKGHRHGTLDRLRDRHPERRAHLLHERARPGDRLHDVLPAPSRAPLPLPQLPRPLRRQPAGTSGSCSWKMNRQCGHTRAGSWRAMGTWSWKPPTARRHWSSSRRNGGGSISC